MSATDPFVDIRNRGPFRSILVNPQWLLQPNIVSLPIPKIAADNCHLYLWTPNPRLMEGLQLVSDWGFVYRDVIVLCKVEDEADPIPGSDRIIERPDGETGFLFEPASMLIFGLKGTVDPKLEERETITKWTHHSAIRRLIEKYSYGPRLEVFSHEQAAGWACWAPLN